jgi:hypothetical protein
MRAPHRARAAFAPAAAPAAAGAAPAPLPRRMAELEAFRHAVARVEAAHAGERLALLGGEWAGAARDDAAALPAWGEAATAGACARELAGAGAGPQLGRTASAAFPAALGMPPELAARAPPDVRARLASGGETLVVHADGTHVAFDPAPPEEFEHDAPEGAERLVSGWWGERAVGRAKRAPEASESEVATGNLWAAGN